MNGNLTGYRILAIALGAALAAGTANATGVDVRNMQGVGKFTLHTAQPAAGTTLDVKLQHSDDNATWTDTGLAFAQVSNAGGYGLQEIVANTDNLKRYVRAVSVTAGAGTPSYSALLVAVPQR